MPHIEVESAKRSARAAISLALHQDGAEMVDLVRGLDKGDLQYMAAATAITASALVRVIATMSGRPPEELWQEMCRRSASHEDSHG